MSYSIIRNPWFTGATFDPIEEWVPLKDASMFDATIWAQLQRAITSAAVTAGYDPQSIYMRMFLTDTPAANDAPRALPHTWLLGGHAEANWQGALTLYQIACWLHMLSLANTTHVIGPNRYLWGEPGTQGSDPPEPLDVPEEFTSLYDPLSVLRYLLVAGLPPESALLREAWKDAVERIRLLLDKMHFIWANIADLAVMPVSGVAFLRTYTVEDFPVSAPMRALNWVYGGGGKWCKFEHSGPGTDYLDEEFNQTYAAYYGIPQPFRDYYPGPFDPAPPGPANGWRTEQRQSVDTGDELITHRWVWNAATASWVFSILTDGSPGNPPPRAKTTLEHNENTFQIVQCGIDPLTFESTEVPTLILATGSSGMTGHQYVVSPHSDRDFIRPAMGSTQTPQGPSYRTSSVTYEIQGWEPSSTYRVVVRKSLNVPPEATNLTTSTGTLTFVSGHTYHLDVTEPTFTLSISGLTGPSVWPSTFLRAIDGVQGEPHLILERERGYGRAKPPLFEVYTADEEFSGMTAIENVFVAGFLTAILRGSEWQEFYDGDKIAFIEYAAGVTLPALGGNVQVFVDPWGVTKL